jgi:hypothetical protein
MFSYKVLKIKLHKGATYVNIIIVILGMTRFLIVSAESQVMYLRAFSEIHSLKSQNSIAAIQLYEYPARTTRYAVRVPTL